MLNPNEARPDIENQRVLPSNWPDIKWDLDYLRVSFSLICVTFGRDEVDSQGTSIGPLNTNTPTFSHPYLPTKRYPDLNSLDTIENTSTCTGTTMVGDLNKYGFDRVLSVQDGETFRNPLAKLRLSEIQRRAISSCRQEVRAELSLNRDERRYHHFVFLLQIEWLLRDEQLSTYFTRRSLDGKLIQNVIEHVQSSVNIHKSNCLSRSVDLKFVLGIEKPIDSFIEVLFSLAALPAIPPVSSPSRNCVTFVFVRNIFWPDAGHISSYSNLSIRRVQLFNNDKSLVSRSRNDESVRKDGLFLR